MSHRRYVSFVVKVIKIGKIVIILLSYIKILVLNSYIKSMIVEILLLSIYNRLLFQSVYVSVYHYHDLLSY